MRQLAELIMRGPRQAALIAAILTALPLLSWLGAATVALVILSRGLSGATAVILAALVPAAGWALIGDVSQLVVLFSVVVLATILGKTMSWQSTLLASLPVALASGWASIMFSPLRDQMIAMLSKQFSITVSAFDLVAMVSAPLLLQQVLVLMLARWWQAGLFNPGGLQRELHALRLPKWMGVTLGLALVAAGMAESPLVWLLTTPLAIAGTCFVHGEVRRRGLGWGWLALYYILLLVGSYPLVIILAFLDSMFDLRKRLPNSSRD